MANDKNLKSKKIAIVALLLLLGTIIGATYAFFTAQKGTGGSAQIEVGADTTDNLSFKGGSTLSIYANADNFKQNGENITDETTVSATLKANNTTNLAEDTYNVYLAIETNELDYTTFEKTPELLVTITDPDGKEIEENSDLVYKENIKNVKGFDVTNKTGVFLIAKDFPIEVTEDAVDGTVTQEWHITLTLINLDTDQEKNTGKEVTGKVVITKDDYDNYKLSHINTLSIEKIDNGLKATLKTTEGTSSIIDYYFALKETGKDLEYNKSAEGNTYTFAELSEDNKYDIYSYAVDSEGFKTNVYETKVTLSWGDIPNITNVDVSDISYNQFTINVTSDKEVSKYIYKIKGGGIEKTIEDESSTYTFTDLADLTNYEINIISVNQENNSSPVYTINAQTRKAEFHENCEEAYASCQIAKMSITNNNIIYHDGKSDYDEMENYILEAEDYSYRYAGSNSVVNNYVCFGSDTCDDQNNYDNLYRIIGLFKNPDGKYEMKLLKADYANSDILGDEGAIFSKANVRSGTNSKKESVDYFFFSQTDDYAWRNSPLNMVNFNKNLYNTFSSKYQEMISPHHYQTNGCLNTIYFNNNAKVDYECEIGKNQVNKVDDEADKIALMYFSDYMYAASPHYWSYNGYTNSVPENDYRQSINDNWAYVGYFEWALSKNGTPSGNVRINAEGMVSNHVSQDGWGVRPVFYLNNQVKIESGEGTITNPYKLVME